MAEHHLSDELLQQLIGKPGFASGGIVQTAREDDDDSVPVILDRGYVVFGRTAEDLQSGSSSDHG